MQKRRVLAISDFHSGHCVGLTHPDFDERPNDTTSVHYRLYKLRRLYWDFYAKTVDALKPIDAIVFCGDAIEGKGEKTGGRELIITDRQEQATCAEACLKYAIGDNTRLVMAYGTPYHVGREEDFEAQIAKNLRAEKIGNHDFCEVNGVIIDYRHKIGGSQSPVGRATALEREKVWNSLWAELTEYPNADIILRGHVHYYRAVDDDRRLGMTLPALQGYGSIFGARECSGIVNFGLVHFDITSKGDYTWSKHILHLRKHAAAAVVKLY